MSSDITTYMHGVYHSCKFLVTSGPKNNIDIIISYNHLKLDKKMKKVFLVKMKFSNTFKTCLKTPRRNHRNWWN